MEDYGNLIKDLRRSFRNGRLRDMEARKDQLRNLYKMLEENSEQIFDALYKDLHKSRVETNLSEVLYTKMEIGNATKNLKKWMKPERVAGDLSNKISTCEIRPDPLGVVLIIGAWNFPIALNLVPLIGAIAAGNCVVIKPSEVSENSAKLMEEMIGKYLDPDCVRVVNGGIPETTALLRERFDHIFYTGSTVVGRIVMKAAAEHLTPVTLELGGKCPVIVDNTCNFEVVGQRIAWGKYVNSGQACLSPDYALCVGEGVQQKLAESVKRAIVKFYGEDQQKSESLARMINKRHFERVKKLIVESKVYYGNVTDEDDLYISPTILENVTEDDDVMKEEIFGPILPLLTVDSIDAAIDFVLNREKALAMYVFTNDYAVSERLSTELSSGGIVVNDVLVHYSATNLPFGGVGESGIGSYHGVHSFKTFSHMKAYVYKNQKMESLNSIRYPPYDENWTPLKVGEWLLTPNVK